MPTTQIDSCTSQVDIVMRGLILLSVLGLMWGCVEEEEIVAYEYDLERLCLPDPNSPIIVDTRQVKDPPEGRTLEFVSVCSVHDERKLVSFQRYFLKGFVECRMEIWGDLYWDRAPDKQRLTGLKCVD